MRKFIIIISLILALASAQMCVNWLPVYLCNDGCFQLDICRDTLNPGYIYDRIFVYGRLEEMALGFSGTWFDLNASPPELPQICNRAYFDVGIGDWIFGWDSIYIAAETSGVIVEDTSIWVFHYPPDSSFVGPNGLTICPLDTGIFVAKWLEVRGAFFWSFVEETIMVLNNFPHRAVMDTTICIKPDHQVYWAPDSLEPWIIDTLYDPCPNSICTTFTLLPTDVVDDGFYNVCLGICETLYVPNFYPYDHILYVDIDSFAYTSSISIDTFVFCGDSCGTTWAFYEMRGSCPNLIIDSFAIIVPCVDYRILVTGSLPHDSGTAFCNGETLRFCLGGELCEPFDSTNVCWNMPGDYRCSFCTRYVADTSFWAFVSFFDCNGCRYFDSIFVNIFDKSYFTLSFSGGCAGNPTIFTVSPDSGSNIISVLFEFGDGTRQFVNVPDTMGNFVAVHTYGSTGDYIAFVTVTTEFGCTQKDSLWLRQSTIFASLTASPLPVCIGSELYLDATGSSVIPASALVYRFYNPASESIYFGENPFAIDTAETYGLYYVWVIDTVAMCSSYASVYVPVISAEIFAPESIYAILGCSRCIDLVSIPHNCAPGVGFGYRAQDNLGNWGSFMPIYGDEFCLPPIVDTTGTAYRIYSWCADCPDGKDSTDLLFLPIIVSANVQDTILCYGALIPNLLLSWNVSPPIFADSIICLVLFEHESGIDTVWRWSPPSLMPSMFSGSPIRYNGFLKYRFALWGETGCFYEVAARVTIWNPEAYLTFTPSDTVCVGTPVCLDASLSYSNCPGFGLSYRYYQVVSGTLLPLNMPCEPSCSIACLGWSLPRGTFQFAVQVCIEGVPWCCDTAFAMLEVCDISMPIVIAQPLCAPDTVLAGDTVFFYVQNANQYDHFCWGIDDISPLCLSIDSVFTYMPDSAFFVRLWAYRCDRACSIMFTDTFQVDYPPMCASACTFMVVEDSCPVVIDLSGYITDIDGIGYYAELISVYDGLSIVGDTLIWDCPTNCDVGIRSFKAAIHDSSTCAAVCTLTITIIVQNRFDGVAGLDPMFGTSCIDEFSLVRANPTSATLTLYNSGPYCYEMSLDLFSLDEGECDCGYSHPSGLFWLFVNDRTGRITADVSSISAGVYNDFIYFSDCYAIDTISIEINVPNHPPRIVSLPYMIFVPRGADTIVAKLSDFYDIDGDMLSWLNYRITNASNYGLTAIGNQLMMSVSNNYTNFPRNPDTLTITVTDGLESVTAKILVWVYNPEDVEFLDRKPNATAIVGAYPNPFNSEIWLEVEFIEEADAILSIHDISGRIVKTVFSGKVPGGVYRFKWNGFDEKSSQVPSGTYFAILHADGKRFIMRIQLIR